MATSSVDLAAIKGRQQQTWASGDFSVVGARITIVGEFLCEAVPLHAGQMVVDVATGSGNTALAAARRGCDVTGADYVPALLERARERARVEGVPATFVDGDAEALPFADGSFDAVLSTFGVMFAPDQPRAARELVRVCRPGGAIALASWTPEGFIGDVFRATAKHVPPPNIASPFAWGTESSVRELLGDGIGEVRSEKRIVIFRERSTSDWIHFMRAYYGPTLRAFAALDESGQQRLEHDLLEVLARFNRSGDETMFVPAEYLEVVARKRR